MTVGVTASTALSLVLLITEAHGQMAMLTALIATVVLVWSEFVYPPSLSGLTPRPTIILILFAISGGAYGAAVFLALLTFLVRRRHWPSWDSGDFGTAAAIYALSVAISALTARGAQALIPARMPESLAVVVISAVASFGFLIANLELVRILRHSVGLEAGAPSSAPTLVGRHMAYALISGGAMAVCIQFFSLVAGLPVLGVAGIAGVTWAAVNARRHRGARTALLRLNELAMSHERETEEHMQRVASYSMALGASIGLSEQRLESLAFAAQLHDIGKLLVPAEIITKPAKLTADEWTEMQTHTTKGALLLSAVNSLRDARDVAASHHERWDGDGYPKGAAGGAIPLPARIVALADSFDAMTSDRAYQPALDRRTAVRRILEASGSQFDPCLASRFIEVVDRGDVDLFESQPLPVVARSVVY